MSEPAITVDAALRGAAQEYVAEASKENAATRKAVEQLNAAAQKAGAEGMSNAQLAGLIVGIGVLFLPKLDRRLVYSEVEQQAIAQAATPVLDKYFPSGALPCELVLLATIGLVTAPKLMPAGAAADGGGPESDDAERAPTT